jgi:hypothetical protein
LGTKQDSETLFILSQPRYFGDNKRLGVVTLLQKNVRCQCPAYRPTPPECQRVDRKTGGQGE